MWAVLSVVAVGLFRVSTNVAIWGALIAVGLHWLSSLIHQLGHAWAAGRTGHPMIGLQWWGLLSTSLYPPDEEPLPARIHLRRALGGPTFSLMLTLIAGLFALIARSADRIVQLVALFFWLDNLFVFTLQAFVPLDFNDGGTLWYWWHRRSRD